MVISLSLRMHDQSVTQTEQKLGNHSFELLALTEANGAKETFC